VVLSDLGTQLLFYKPSQLQLAPYELTHVRAPPGDCAAGLEKQNIRSTFEETSRDPTSTSLEFGKACPSAGVEPPIARPHSICTRIRIKSNPVRLGTQASHGLSVSSVLSTEVRTDVGRSASLRARCDRAGLRRRLLGARSGAAAPRAKGSSALGPGPERRRVCGCQATLVRHWWPSGASLSWGGLATVLRSFLGGRRPLMWRSAAPDEAIFADRPPPGRALWWGRERVSRAFSRCESSSLLTVSIATG